MSTQQKMKSLLENEGERLEYLVVQGILDQELSKEEILRTLPNNTYSFGQLRALFEGLEMMGIELVERKAASGHNDSGNSGYVKAADLGSKTSGDNLIQLYFEEIGRTSLLSAEEEVRLGKAVQVGLESAERLEEPAEALGDQERQILSLKALRGDIAKRHMMKANLRLVVSIAKRFTGGPLSLLDLVQEGNMGLLHAIERFDPDKGFRFSTYATWVIRQAISRALTNQGRTIRLPAYLVDSVNQLHRALQELHHDLEREPSLEEIALHLDYLSVKDARVVRSWKANGGSLPDDVRNRLAEATQKIHSIMRVSKRPASLEEPVTESDDTTLADFIGDEETASPLERTSRNLMHEQLYSVLDILEEREQQVLTMRFGLDDGQGATLREVGEHFDLTRERIRQIEAEALRKLRRSDQTHKLKGLTG